MSHMIATVLQLTLALFGALPLPEIGVLGLAVAAIALAVLAITAMTVAPVGGIRQSVHPRRAIDVSAVLAQSDPDAAGHPRPRAPGVARAA